MDRVENLSDLSIAQAVGIGIFLLLMLASMLVWSAVGLRWHQRLPACPAASPGRRTWSLGMTVSALVVVIPLQVFVLGAIGKTMLDEKPAVEQQPDAGEKEPQITLRAVQAACLLNGLQVLVLIGLAALVSPVEKTDLGAVWSIEDLAIGVAGFLACWLPVNIVNGLVTISGWRAPDGKHPFFLLLDQDSTVQTIAWLSLSVIVMAPLAEELMYRAVLQGWLEQRVPAWLAIAITATLFAAVHHSPGRPDAIPLWPLAMILGYIYHQRRSLPAVILLHGLFNGTMLTLAVLMEG